MANILVPDVTLEAEPTSTFAPRKQTGREPIAITGIGCRFPGANSADELWDLLKNGRDAISELPPERFDINSLYDPRPGVPKKIVTRNGGFLSDIDQFDAAFFGISPREAVLMDPQQRLLLEVAWEAFEDAGQSVDRIYGAPIGVFLGVCYHDYADIQIKARATTDLYANTGSALSIAAGRISYTLGLQGPAVTVDTACSSSLIAAHLAALSIWQGECAQALVAGANIILQPEPTMGFSGAGMLAPDGHCKCFDASADGFVRGDGVAGVVLKPLDRALADGDPIYALILGSAANNDGRSGGLLMAPSVSGQEQALRQAYEAAGVEPAEVDYIEAHGTGTVVGDPIELEALAQVVGPNRPADRPCLVGSVKSNLGHTEAAAGVAGLIKVALSLKHRQIPKSLHFEIPNPAIPWEQIPVRVQSELTPWPSHSRPARAGVSSFGISGTNAHMVLQEAPRRAQRTLDAEGAPLHLLPLSARSPQALAALAGAYQSWLGSQQLDADESPQLRDIAYTASLRRTHHRFRLTVVGSTLTEIADSLRMFVAGEPIPTLSVGQTALPECPKLVFVFPGQGAQWLGMGRGLLGEETAFRATIERCREAFRPHVDWDPITVLNADDSAWLRDISVIQPLTFAVQVGLAAQWESWGIRPDAVVGHSFGEVAAAYVSGALSLEDATQVICVRSRLMQRVRGQGGMAVVELSQEDTETLIAEERGRLSVSVSNSPTSTVIGGDPKALERILARLEEKEVFCRPIEVDVASHSPQMEPLLEPLAEALEGLDPRGGRIPMMSTVTGRLVSGEDLGAGYWTRNLRQPVQFGTAVAELAGTDHGTFVELSPHPMLTAAVDQSASDHMPHGHSLLTLGSLRREEDEQQQLLVSLGSLYAKGYPIRWEVLCDADSRCIRLPPYPWQRARFWLDEDIVKVGLSTSHTPWLGAEGAGHPLLGLHLELADSSRARVWQGELSSDEISYLSDHVVQGSVVLPGAACVEMALAAATQAFPSRTCVIEYLALEKALLLPEGHKLTTQFLLTPGAGDTAEFQLMSRAKATGDWSRHASGGLRLQSVSEETPPLDLAQIRDRCRERVTAEEHYEKLKCFGLHYGNAFRGVAELWRGDKEVLARLEFPPEVTADTVHLAHPAVLDACLQTLVDTGDAAVAEGDTYLPVSIDDVRILGSAIARTGTWVYSRQVDAGGQGDAGALENRQGSVSLADEDGNLLLEVKRIRMQQLGQAESVATEDLEEWYYGVRWFQTPLEPGRSGDTEWRQGTWLIFADGSGVAQRLSERLAQNGICRKVLVGRGAAFEAVGAMRYRIDPTCADDYDRVITAIKEDDPTPIRQIVYLWGLDYASAEVLPVGTLAHETSLECMGAVHLLQAMAKRPQMEDIKWWLVTRGAQAVVDGDASLSPQAALVGIGRVLAVEHGELCCTRIDLDASRHPTEEGCTEEADALLREMAAGSTEDEVALRSDQRYVGRLTSHKDAAAETGQGPVLTVAGDRAYRLEIATPGLLDTLTLCATRRQPPEADQLEIEIAASGLNFKDILLAMGVVPIYDWDEGIPLGFECAGRVTRVGEGVTEFHPGDEVIALLPRGFSRYALTHICLAAPKPTGLTSEEAATIPAVFLTAYYALHHLARMRQGERVLIHSASGGVGLAAIQIAKRVGAEIYATAGNPDKRSLLKSLGIRHVMDSRSLEFADQIMKLTNGGGVDVVLSSLVGEAATKSLACLAPQGRFLEIGKRDLFENRRLGLQPFLKGLSYFAIDLGIVCRQSPKLIQSLFHELVEQFESGELNPLPARIYPLAEVAEAFRYMAQGKHTGKLILTHSDPEQVEIAPAVESEPLCESDASYLITGGMGGLGLRVAAWLIDQGASTLVLTGRRGPSAEAQSAIEAMQQAGACVEVVTGDVSNEQDVRHIMTHIREFLPPLRGVMHAAGLLDDGILLQLDQPRFERVMQPKIDGSWNLHRETLDEPLDFFVLFSSAASLFGSPGQGNYVAGNAFMDALAHYRLAQGRPALSVNWGPWAEVGLAASQDNRGGRLEYRGIKSFTPDQGLAALGQLMRWARSQAGAQVGVVPFDAEQWREFYPNVARLPLFSRLVQEIEDGEPTEAEGPRLRLAVQAAEPKARRGIVEDYLREQIGAVLRLAPSEVDVHSELMSLGLDSLMALELRNRLENGTGLKLAATFAWSYPTIFALAGFLEEKLSAAPAPTEGDQPAGETESLAAGAESAEPERSDGLSSKTLVTAVRMSIVSNVSSLYAEAQLEQDIRFEHLPGVPAQAPQEVLLTGATGFLGAFLLHELLRQSTAQVVCLVRAKDDDEAMDRLTENLARYGLWQDAYNGTRRARIRPLRGDLTQPRLGLVEAAYDELASRIEAVYHNAASVNWTYPYQALRDVNVGGTREILRLVGHKRRIPLHYVSTVGVFPATGGAVFSENTSLDHGGDLYGGYAQSKWVAEKLVTAAKERGLPASIYRPSIVIGDSRTGLFNQDAYMENMIKGCIELGEVPRIETHVDLVPVDYAAQAIVHLSLRREGHPSRFHLTNPKPMTSQDLLEWMLAFGYDLKEIELGTWKKELFASWDEGTLDLEKLQRNALYPFSAFLEEWDESRAVMPWYGDENVRRGLSDSRIRCPAADDRLLRTCFESFIASGFLPAPAKYAGREEFQGVAQDFPEKPDRPDDK
jgi:thioester reductase-like protein